MAVAGSLALLLGLAAWPALGQSEKPRIDFGVLNVAIRDKATGKSVPAMICITSLADNTWVVPPDGQHPAGYHTNPEIIQGRLQGIEYLAGMDKKWFPGDPGPAVLMTGDTKADAKATWTKQRRNPWYQGNAVPFWNDPAAYFVSKPFTIVLKPGKWRLAVMRGIEYRPVFEEFTVASGQVLDRNVQMARWVDMPAQGWYSGDMHVHSPRIAPVQDVFIMTWAKSMDVHMTGVHSYGNINEMEGCPQAHYGKASQYRDGDYWLESGHEGPREPINEQGHATQLHMPNLVRDTAKYHLYDYVFDGVHAQGGLAGYTHLAWSGDFYRHTNRDSNPGWDAAINLIRGKIDFIDILESARLGTEYYYDFLNLGVKLTAMSDSDCPAALVGEERAYAYTGPGKFTADAYFDAMKHGHTFVTNGPMLLLTIGKAIPGDEVRVLKNAKVHVHAQAWAPESIGNPKVLEVVSQGRVIRTVEAPNAKQEKLSVDFDLPAGESQWIAARTSAANGAVAHTSPIYVIVDGKSFVDRAHAKELAAKYIKVLDFIEAKRLNTNYTKNWAPGEVDQLKARIADARAKYLAVGQAK
jgi:hypothetical protein